MRNYTHAHTYTEINKTYKNRQKLKIQAKDIKGKNIKSK